MIFVGVLCQRRVKGNPVEGIGIVDGLIELTCKVVVRSQDLAAGLCHQDLQREIAGVASRGDATPGRNFWYSVVNLPASAVVSTGATL